MLDPVLRPVWGKTGSSRSRTELPLSAPIADIRWTAEPVGFDLPQRFKAAERRKVVEISKDWPRTIARPLLMGGPISEPQAKRCH
jgi:hypothetical protein